MGQITLGKLFKPWLKGVAFEHVQGRYGEKVATQVGLGILIAPVRKSATLRVIAPLAQGYKAVRHVEMGTR